MLRRSILITIFALALLAVPAMTVPPGPVGQDGFVAQCEIPVCILIDKYAELICPGECLYLHEKPNEWWEGYDYVTIFNNWSVRVNADIEPYLPTIVTGLNNFDVLIEGDPLGFNGDAHSQIDLSPYPGGYTMRIWAGIQSPNLLARASSPDPQVVAIIYITVQN